MSIAEALNKYYRVETNSVIVPYVFRDHAWNHESEENTNFKDYKADVPHAYGDHIVFEVPHPTNIPLGTEVADDHPSLARANKPRQKN